jgi:hypothetical protein
MEEWAGLGELRKRIAQALAEAVAPDIEPDYTVLAEAAIREFHLASMTYDLRGTILALVL